MTSSLKTVSLCFYKKAESFENLENILPNWLNKDEEKCLSDSGFGQVLKAGKRKKNTFLCRKRLEKKYSSSLSRALFFLYIV